LHQAIFRGEERAVRTSRRPATAAGLGLGLAAVAVVATGCSIASPATIRTPYAASDGSNGQVGSVVFRNFLAVSEAKGEPGVVIGAVTTEGTESARVQLTVLDADGRTSLGQTTVTVKPGQLVTVGTGTGATAFQLKDVPVEPGAILTLRATTDAGNADLTLPVLAPENQYKTITPTAAPSTSAASSASATATTSS
jgi:hypothetical protein